MMRKIETSNRQSLSVKRILFFFIGIALLNSCVSEGGRKGRPFIKDSSIGGTTQPDAYCAGRAYRVSDASCSSSCPSGETHVASEEEKVETVTSVNEETNLTEEEKTSIITTINSAALVCLEGTGIVRPDGEVKIDKGFCACIGGKRDTINNCDAFCATKNDTAATLYGTVKVGPAIELNPELGNLANWCTAEINEFLGPSCVLEVSSDDSVTNLTINIPPGSNTFTANISSLDFRKTYRARIVEVGSNSNNASSDYIQIYRVPQDDGSTPSTSPLKFFPVSMYSCMFRDGSQQGSDAFFNNAARVHYFYASGALPPAMPPGNVFDICHDTRIHGTTDSILYPRFELIPAHMLLWDYTDIKFADVNPTDGDPDINTIIRERLEEEYNEIRTDLGKLFALMPWQNFPLADNNPNLGFIMKAFIDKQSGEGFCPGEAEYNGSRGDNLFRVLKEVIGTPTEGLFMAEREKIGIPDENGNITGTAPDDFMMIRESQLKEISFYLLNQVPQHPVDTAQAGSKTVMFYWPPDPVNPTVRKSNQRIYVVKSPEDLGQTGATSGLNTSIRPPDKRFACIPKLN